MRADRLLSILLLLQVHRRLTARDLAGRLDVSERTIHRDMLALSGAGVPVLAERGPHGGWELLDSYQTNLTGLNEAEIQALFLSRPPRLLEDLGLDRAAEAGLIKLLAALPSGSRPGAEEARQRIHVDPVGWKRGGEAHPLLPALQDAVWHQRRVELTYERADESRVQRVVEPLGLVAKGSTWYLVAAVDGEPRTYRVSRVESARPLGESFARPSGFDLATYWEQSAATFAANLPQYPVVLRARESALGELRRAGRFSRVEREEAVDQHGWASVAMMFEDEHSAAEVILGFGAQVKVEEPEALRLRVTRTAREIVDLYAEHAASMTS